MKLTHFIVAAAATFLISTNLGWAQGSSGVDRLYILDCGQGHAPDQSRWSPGVNVGVPIDVVDNCYLIHHLQGYFLWDTGIADQVADMPNGIGGIAGAPSWRRPKKLADQLAAIGVSPADVRIIAVSHTHPDHCGNVDLFPSAMLLIQKAEYEWAFSRGNPGFFAAGSPRFSANHPVTKLEGDRDVFGDGSVTIISTPGHTPGHQSLLVQLPETGWLILSGDAVHFKDNWDNRRVPAFNTDKGETLTSMQHIADLMAKYHAQLWINHDKAQSEQQKHAPEFYE